jgi:uncharacterized protein (TIGR00255 family)
MIKSMTGFARLQSSFDWGQASWEIRSVNHRYLEPHFRLPDNLRHIEPALRELLKKFLSRGKLDVSLQIQTEASSSQFQVNQELLQQVTKTAELIAQSIEKPAKLNPIELLQWPGVIKETGTDLEQFEADALSKFGEAIELLVDQRSREGTEIAKMINTRLQAIHAIVVQVREKLPEIRANQRQRIIDRIENLKLEVGQDRLEQELVYLAQKNDVDEELDRLEAHIREVNHCLNQKKATGRRLDFLMQELNREANTLSSKSTTSDMTQGAVELKVLIEQMREQIQNIE